MIIANESYDGLTVKVAAVCVALDERDPSTRRHCDRVCALSLELGMVCALSGRELDLLRLAAGFHDVGKIGIPDSVLKKTTRLSEDDWAIMKTDSARSERIILAAGLDDGGAVGTRPGIIMNVTTGPGIPTGWPAKPFPSWRASWPWRTPMMRWPTCGTTVQR